MRNSALGDDETGFDDENDVTTDTDNESEADFDSSDDDQYLVEITMLRMTIWRLISREQGGGVPWLH